MNNMIKYSLRIAFTILLIGALSQTLELSKLKTIIEQKDKNFLSYKIATTMTNVALEEDNKRLTENLEKEKSLVIGGIKETLNIKYNPYVTDSIIDSIYTISKEMGINPLLTAAIIRHESYSNPEATSISKRTGNKIAYGIMQINYRIWKTEYSINEPEELYEVGNNIRIGLQIFKHYYEKENDLAMALFRYNNGYIYNNKNYAPKIISTYGYYSSVYGENDEILIADKSSI